MSARLNWRDAAACGRADPELFFPVGATGPALRQIDEAKRVCRSCPVRAPCLAWALDHDVTAGVWGGTTEEERHAIQRGLTTKTESMAWISALPSLLGDRFGRGAQFGGD
jgi:WhiB family transcriptional regulator, redox-sensing transcriptional regulator